jgi:Tfp pilus assembly protein PilP
MSIVCGVFLMSLGALSQTPARKAAKPAPVAAKVPSAAENVAPVARAERELVPTVPPPLYREARYQPSNRRDPFLNPLASRKTGKPGDEEMPRGPAPPGIAGMRISDVKLKGTSIGEDIRTAVFEGTDKRIYFLHQGDRLYDGFLRSITTDSVVMVRETMLRSGQTLAQEVTKQLRTP